MNRRSFFKKAALASTLACVAPQLIVKPSGVPMVPVMSVFDPDTVAYYETPPFYVLEPCPFHPIVFDRIPALYFNTVDQNTYFTMQGRDWEPFFMNERFQRTH